MKQKRKTTIYNFNPCYLGNRRSHQKHNSQVQNPQQNKINQSLIYEQYTSSFFIVNHALNIKPSTFALQYLHRIDLNFRHFHHRQYVISGHTYRSDWYAIRLVINRDEFRVYHCPLTYPSSSTRNNNTASCGSSTPLRGGRCSNWRRNRRHPI